jgi:hypothetical protein
MKRYLLSVVTPAEGTPPAPEVLGAIMERVAAVHEELNDAGALVFSGGLAAPGGATVVRLQGDEILITDGPYAEGNAYIGGFSIIQAADLDEALTWGTKLTRAIGLAIEVRPFVDDYRT